MNDFSKGSITKHLLKLAIPMTVAQIINVLYNIIDRVFIGRIPVVGTTALTGLGLCFPLITFISAFANLVGMGGSPLFSIERGRKREDIAGKILGNSVTLLLIFGFSLTIIGLIVKKPVLIAFGASSQTLPYALSYISIYLIGTTFVMMSLGLNYYINAQGFSTIGMLSVAIGAIINMILDPLFIYALNMGVSGAALATIISQFISCLWILRFLTGKKTLIKIEKKNMTLDFKICKKMIALGFSGFVMQITNSIVQVVCNSTLSIYGGDLYIGVMTVLNSIREIVVLPVTGLTNGGQPVLSFNYGAKQNKRVIQTIKVMTLMTLVYTFIAWAMVHFYPSFFIHIFNQEEKLVEAAIISLNAYFMGFFMQSFQFAGQSTFVGLGKSKQAVFFSIFRKVIIVVPLTLILPHYIGVLGVFYAEPISNFVGGLACYITMVITVRNELKKSH